MILTFIENYQDELIITGFVLLALLIARFASNFTITKVARKNEINEARIRLITRYVTASWLILALVIIAFIFGTDFRQLALIFSSLFAIIGIGLFAVWSILSNITSGIIMFFSFPYKVGDKIQIHDKDFPLEAVIEDIRPFHLHLRLDNGGLVTYPNNLMLQKAVTLVEKDAIEDFYNDHPEETY